MKENNNTRYLLKISLIISFFSLFSYTVIEYAPVFYNSIVGDTSAVPVKVFETANTSTSVYSSNSKDAVVGLSERSSKSDKMLVSVLILLLVLIVFVILLIIILLFLFKKKDVNNITKNHSSDDSTTIYNYYSENDQDINFKDINASYLKLFETLNKDESETRIFKKVVESLSIVIDSSEDIGSKQVASEYLLKNKKTLPVYFKEVLSHCEIVPIEIKEKMNKL